MKTPNMLAATLGFCAVACAYLFIENKSGQVSTPENYQVYIDPSFNSENRSEITSTLKSWQKATRETSHPISFHPVIVYRMCEGRCGNGVITIHPGTRSFISSHAGKPAIGLTDFNNNIFVDPDLEIVQSKKVFAHEVGHSIGLQHFYEDKPSVMRADVSEMSDDISEADIIQFKETRGECDEGMYFCAISNRLFSAR